MRMTFDLTFREGYYKVTSSSSFAENVIEMATDPDQYEKNKRRMAEDMVAMAMGLHGNPTQLFQKFNLTFATQKR